MNLKCLSRLPAAEGSNRLNPLNRGVFERVADLSSSKKIEQLNRQVEDLIKYYDLYPSTNTHTISSLPDLQALQACQDLLNVIRKIASESGQALQAEVMCNILTIDGVQEDYRRLAIRAV